MSWQLLDPRELAAHPFQSLTLLHIQPPLFNLFVGSVLRWSPLPAALTFQIFFTGCGLVMVIALRSLLVALGFAPVVATIGAAMVAANPVLFSYENTVNYEYPVALMLVLSALACVRYAERRSTWQLLWLVTLLTTIALVRALFHPVWLLAAVTLVVFAVRPRPAWRQVAGILAIPVVLIGAVFMKNQVLFNEPTMSSWFGLNLGRGVVSLLPRHDFDALIRSGDLSQAARVLPFSPYDYYAPYFGPCRTHFREPVLRSPTKYDGRPNLNAACYLPVYRDAQTNALHAIAARPGAYLSRRWPALAQHFSLPSVDEMAPGIGRFGHNRVLKRLRRVYTAALVSVPITVDDRDRATPLYRARYDVPVSLVLVLGTLLVACRGIAAFVALVRRRGPPRNVAWAYLGLTVAYVTLVSIATEYPENQRFRVMLDPLVFGILIAGAVTLVGWLWRTSRRVHA